MTLAEERSAIWICQGAPGKPCAGDFAQQMITDHEAVLKSVIELAGKLGLTPVENETSKSLKDNSVETTAKLKLLKGKAFDKFYIDNEVAYHKLVTDAVSGVLIPSAQNPQRKSALEGAKPLLIGHLEHARNVQATIGTSVAKKFARHSPNILTCQFRW